MALVALGVWYFFFRTVERPLEVAGHSWQRTVEVELEREVEEEAWAVPPGGRQTGVYQAIHHYDKVFSHNETRTRSVQVQTGTRTYKCGTRDLGNGYFQDEMCTEPVYSTRQESYQEPVYHDVPRYQAKYRYRIWRWGKERELTAQGHGLERVHWPDTAAATAGPRRRAGARRERYVLHLEGAKGQRHQAELPEARWRSLRVGQEVRARFSSTGAFRGLAEEAKPGQAG